MKTRFVNTSLSLLFIIVLFTACPARADEDDGIIRVKSAVPMSEAIARIKADIAGKGIRFFSEVDQAKLADDAGIRLRPSTLLVFGNPPLGTQFITSNPNAGLDWPVRLLLTQDDNGDVWAVWTDFEWIARRHNITDRVAQFKMATMVVEGLPAGRRHHEIAEGVGAMKRDEYDVLIIGGGNGGIGVTGPVRRAGMSVAMIESHDLGGTCPNRGCTPKKVLVAAGHALHEIERARVHHISVGQPRLDWAALIDREKELIKDIPSRLAQSMARREVEIIRGRASFAAANTIRVGERHLEAKHVVIATGSKPRPFSIPGAEHLITSDHMLTERSLPGSVIFIGGGVISLEFGHVYARAGAAVTILEALPQLLPAMDADSVAHLQAESERIGIHIKTGVKVRRIDRANGRLRVVFNHDGIEHATEADRVVNGAGRVANVDMLDLAAGNVEHRDGRIVLDRHLRSTSNPGVYVCGDAIPTSPQLSPVASYEGEIVGRNIAEGPKHATDYGGLPTSVYTVPALAAVGLTEAAARQSGLAIKVHTNEMQDWFSAKTYAETVAWSKIIVDQVTDRILGAHFVGHEGQELVNVFGLAMRFGITASEIKDFI